MRPLFLLKWDSTEEYPYLLVQMTVISCTFMKQCTTKQHRCVYLFLWLMIVYVFLKDLPSFFNLFLLGVCVLITFASKYALEWFLACVTLCHTLIALGIKNGKLCLLLHVIYVKDLRGAVLSINYCQAARCSSILLIVTNLFRLTSYFFSCLVYYFSSYILRGYILGKKERKIEAEAKMLMKLLR